MKRTQAPKTALKPIFGRNLQEVYNLGGGLPPVFWDTLRLLSVKGLTTPGLFRTQPNSRCRRGSSAPSGCSSSSMSSSTMPTSQPDSCTCEPDEAQDAQPVPEDSGRKVLLCKRLYDSGQDALRVLPSVTKDLHAVAGVLKLWVSSLPEPVIPIKLYDAALATQSDHATREAQVTALHVLLRQCEHRVLQVLYPLMEFLHHYCLNQSNARRERQELARAFAPLVLRPADRSVMAPSDDGGLAAQCVEHMIREYRTLFVARKRAIVPPSLPAAKSAAPAAEPAMAPSANGPNAKGHSQLTLKVRSSSADDLASSPSAHALANFDSDVEMSPAADDSTMCHYNHVDPSLEEAVSDLLFSSTAMLFAAPAGAAGIDIFQTSPSSSPESSPSRGNRLAEAEDKLEASAVKTGDSPPPSPNSIPGGWAAMSDGDSSASEDSDIALAEAEHTAAAAAAFPATATACNWATADPMDAAVPAAWQVSHFAQDGAGDASHCFAQPPQVGTSDCFKSFGTEDHMQQGGLWEAPAVTVAYVAPAAVPTAAAALAVEKTALKRQLRQLDADFQASTGRAPSKEDKQALRPLYVRYWRLKRALALAAAHEEASSAGAARPAALAAAPCSDLVMMEA